MKWGLLISLLLVGTGCGNTTSHVPNPLLLPGQAVATGIENAVYNARRGKVSAHVKAHHEEIVTDIEQGNGPHLQQGIALARVAPARQPQLLAALRKDLALYRSDPEALVVALMVHGP